MSLTEFQKLDAEKVKRASRMDEDTIRWLTCSSVEETQRHIKGASLRELEEAHRRERSKAQPRKTALAIIERELRRR